ncbi:MAG: hypothetical protein AAF754_00375 [Pseudomonadota bacterium]
MKKVIFATAVLVAVSGAAFAGGLEEPEVEAPLVVADATNSSSGAAVAVLMTLVTFLPALQ